MSDAPSSADRKSTNPGGPSLVESARYFRNGGGLYGIAYTAWRGFRRFKALLATGFYRRVLGSCGKGTTFGNGVVALYPRNIEVGNDCSMGDNVSLISDSPDGRLIVSSGTQISSGVHIDFTGNVAIGERVLISAETRIYTHDHGHDPRSDPRHYEIVVENDVWIGFGIIVLANVQRVGKGAVIGAGAVVTKPVPDWAIVAGNPARIIGRRDDSPAESA